MVLRRLLAAAIVLAAALGTPAARAEVRIGIATPVTGP